MMACGSPRTEVVDEFEKLVIRMNPPRVTVDNTSDMTATLVKVDSANKYGTLLEVVQVLTDLKLTIKRAYISSDGEWFMDVFHVVDQEGNKLYDCQVIDRIELSLGAGSLSFRAPERSVGVEAEAEAAQTAIELIGKDRPGLLSEVFAVLTDLKCNIVASEVWTHDARMAALVYVTDADTLGAIDDPDRLDSVKRLLRHLLRGGSGGGGSGPRDRKAAARAAIPSRVAAAAHAPRRLHQMMHDDRARCGDAAGSDDVEGGRGRPVVEVVDCAERDYTLVNVRCRDRPKLLFDTVCTLTDMQYVVFHGTVIAEGSEAYQEYYIRHLDDSPVTSGVEREHLRRCLEAAIQRRNTEQGVRLELCCEDRVGLLSDVTRIFREHGLSVTHAEVATRAARAANVFYVVDASGEAVQAQAVEAVRAEIGEQVLFVREDAAGAGAAGGPRSPPGRDRRSLGNMIRSRSEKFLYNLGLIRSCS
ncbi:ACT domain-containing protein ACR4-like [Oryza brachyantha]|uniref:ACT domain-containing protein ACR4-like n=1 Tax=Oryza brachyantha TaxID=4533 RepID=UPI001ADA8FCB|nr:ACT domain-containing protein ACR4-like [Oryza brachyantha]